MIESNRCIKQVFKDKKRQQLSSIEIKLRDHLIKTTWLFAALMFIIWAFVQADSATTWELFPELFSLRVIFPETLTTTLGTVQWNWLTVRYHDSIISSHLNYRMQSFKYTRSIDLHLWCWATKSCSLQKAGSQILGCSVFSS